MNSKPGKRRIKPTVRILALALKVLATIALALALLELTHCRQKETKHNNTPAPHHSVAPGLNTPLPVKSSTREATTALPQHQPIALTKTAVKNTQATVEVATAYHSPIVEVAETSLSPPHKAIPHTSDKAITDTNSRSDVPQSSGIIKRIDSSQLPLAAPPTPAYIDRLIDPEKLEDSRENKSFTPRKTSNTYHTVLAGAIYRDSTAQSKATIDSGIEYTSTTLTENAGDIRLNVVALNDDNNNDAFSNLTTKNGIRRASIAQLNFALNETLTMDNILGTHRSTPYRFVGNRRGIINQRFSISNPDIIGLTTRIKTTNDALTLSLGELGESRGNFLPGFEKTSGSVYRAQFDRSRETFALSAELWKTDSRLDNDQNRIGSRVNFSFPINFTNDVHLTLSQSDSQIAALGSWRSNKSFSSQEFGVYYFEPDFFWIDTLLGNDNIGAFFRHSQRWNGNNLSFNLEHRKDGLSSDSLVDNQTSFFGSTFSTRLNRKFHFTSYYAYRNSQSNSPNFPDNNRDEHTIRLVGTNQHDANSASSLGLSYRNTEQTDFSRLYYSWRNTFNDDSDLNITAEVNHESQNNTSSSPVHYGLNIDWQKNFGNRSYLSVGLNYDEENNSSSNNSNSVGGYISYDWSITSQLGLNIQLDHNRFSVENENTDIANTLFVSPAFDTDENFTVESTSALVTLRYNFGGGNNRSSNLGKKTGKLGSGALAGRLFIDENGDGIDQPNEAGLAGITVYLDGIDPVITDSNGRFYFRRVSPGKHYIYTDESNIPLPWRLPNSEYYNTDITLRKTTKLSIPITKLSN